MSGAKHTPGPWVAKPSDDNYSIRATGGTFGDIALAFDWSENGEPDPEAQANARLIAAAPDLLRNLKACAERLDETRARTSQVDIAVVAAACAAIAKATGAAQ